MLERRGTATRDRISLTELTTADLGGFAEELAVQMLRRRGARIVARNVKVEDGELDILALVGGERTVVEVRSVRAEPDLLAADPVAAFDRSKANQVRRLAGSIGCGRVDVVAIRFWERGVDLHWLADCA